MPPHQHLSARQLLSNVKHISRLWDVDNKRRYGSQLHRHMHTLREALTQPDINILTVVERTMELAARKRVNIKATYMTTFLEYTEMCRKSKRVQVNPETLINILYASTKLSLANNHMNSAYESWCTQATNTDFTSSQPYIRCLYAVTRLNLPHSKMLETLEHYLVVKERNFFTSWEMADVLINLGGLRVNKQIHSLFSKYASALDESIKPTGRLWSKKRGLIIESAFKCKFRSRPLLRLLSKDIVGVLSPGLLLHSLRYVAFIGPPFPNDFLKLSAKRILLMHEPSLINDHFRRRLSVDHVLSFLEVIPQIRQFSEDLAAPIVRQALLLLPYITPVEVSKILFLLSKIPYTPNEFYVQTFKKEIDLQFDVLSTSEVSEINNNLRIWEAFAKGGDLIAEMKHLM